MKLSRKLFVLLLAAGSFIAGTVHAEVELPDVLIKRVSQEVLDIAKTDKLVQAGNQQRIMEVVVAKVIPHVDFQRMTAMAASGSS